MIGAYKAGKDLYATIATQIHHNNYWDNMEFTDETKTVPNPEGKKRRSAVKSLLLGGLLHYAQTKRCEPLFVGVT